MTKEQKGLRLWLWRGLIQVATSYLKVVVISFVAISAMLLMCIVRTHAYHVQYYDCREPTTIERFSKPSICTLLSDTSSEQALGKS